ncbi:MAG TPA: pantetheine-phosphate adenylyltransferase [Verrucomicrobiae bacterium]|nr:pantetheine-phosphate adenylyltransferase [Verrucomicrobiae bacterium]
MAATGSGTCGDGGQRRGDPGTEVATAFRGLLRPPFFFLVIRILLGSVRAMRTVIYPGSFDPLTNGHLDVIQRATKLFDRVVVAVAASESKHPLFALEERLSLVKQAVVDLANVEADAFDGLLIHYVEQRGAQAVVRGLRAVSDFEFEFQLALMNRKLNERIETIFMMPKDTYTFLSSRIVKEIARLGGDVSAFVPAHVQVSLRTKLVAPPA